LNRTSSEIDPILGRAAASPESTFDQPREYVRPGELLDLEPHLLQVESHGGAGDLLDRRIEGDVPCEGVQHRVGGCHDLRPAKVALGEPDIELVVPDLPAAADDAPGREVQPLGAAPNLDLLAARQPVAAFPQAVLQNDGDVLQRIVQVGAAGEIETEDDELGRLPIEVQAAHHPWRAEVLGAHADLVHADLPLRQADGEGVGQRVVVQARTTAGQGMRHVPHLLALAQSNVIGEVVLHDPEMVPMVLDVRGKVRPVPPPDDALLAAVRSLPVNFQHQLIGLDEPRGLGEPFTELAEEEHEPMRADAVIHQRGVGPALRPPRDAAADQRRGSFAVPRLGEEWSGSERQEYGDEGATVTHHAAISRPPRLAASALVAALR
jgi:hypothetical protein